MPPSTTRACEEKGHQQRFLDDERALVAFIGLREAEEHQKQPQEGDRMVSQRDDTDKKDKVHGNHGHRNRRPRRIGSGAGLASRWRRSATVATLALTTTAMAAFQPKVTSMKELSQPHVEATISTGGAAKDVSVPPMETFTNSTPRARYLTPSGTSGSENLRGEHQRRNGHGRGLRDDGPQQRHRGQAEPGGGQRGTHRQTTSDEVHRADHRLQHGPRGRDHHHHEDEQRLRVLPRFRVRQRLVAALMAAMANTSTMAQKPKTTSTSPRR